MSNDINDTERVQLIGDSLTAEVSAMTPERRAARLDEAAEIQRGRAAVRQQLENTIASNSLVLELFVSYLNSPGIRLHFIEAIAMQLFGQPVEGKAAIGPTLNGSPAEMFDTAFADFTVEAVIRLHDQPYRYLSTGIERIITGAPSLAFLVRYASHIDISVLPQAVIPPNNVVQACLQMFHIRKTGF